MSLPNRTALLAVVCAVHVKAHRVGGIGGVKKREQIELTYESELKEGCGASTFCEGYAQLRPYTMERMMRPHLDASGWKVPKFKG